MTCKDEAELVRVIDDTIAEAERQACYACMVCGAKTQLTRYRGRGLIVCPEHDPYTLNGPAELGLEGLWRAALEGEDPFDVA
jgi:hypothetical protein